MAIETVEDSAKSDQRGRDMAKLKIGLASREYVMQRNIDIAAGRLVPKKSDPKLWVSSLESIGRLLSKDNYAMIEAIRKYHPKTISELAKLINREHANVSRTLSRMVDFNIVEFLEADGKKQPIVNWDEIVIIPTSAA